jgi:hypothetical protein
MRRRLEHTDEPRTEIGHTPHLRVSIGTARPPFELMSMRIRFWPHCAPVPRGTRSAEALIFWHSDVSPVRITNHRSLLGAGNMSSVGTGRLKAATGPVHGAFDATNDDP